MSVLCIDRGVVMPQFVMFVLRQVVIAALFFLRTVAIDYWKARKAKKEEIKNDTKPE